MLTRNISRYLLDLHTPQLVSSGQPTAGRLSYVDQPRRVQQFIRREIDMKREVYVAQWLRIAAVYLSTESAAICRSLYTPLSLSFFFFIVFFFIFSICCRLVVFDNFSISFAKVRRNEMSDTGVDQKLKHLARNHTPQTEEALALELNQQKRETSQEHSVSDGESSRRRDKKRASDGSPTEYLRSTDYPRAERFPRRKQLNPIT